MLATVRLTLLNRIAAQKRHYGTNKLNIPSTNKWIEFYCPKLILNIQNNVSDPKVILLIFKIKLSHTGFWCCLINYSILWNMIWINSTYTKNKMFQNNVIGLHLCLNFIEKLQSGGLFCRRVSWRVFLLL